MFGVLRLESLRKGYDRHQPEFLQTEPSGVIFQVRAQCLENKFLLWIEVKDKVGSKESWRRWALGRLKGGPALSTRDGIDLGSRVRCGERVLGLKHLLLGLLILVVNIGDCCMSFERILPSVWQSEHFISL